MNKLIKKKIISFFFFKLNFYFSNFFKKNELTNFLNVFFLSLQLKNLTLLSNFFKIFLEKIHFKLHKVFFKKINFLIHNFFFFFKKKFKIKGIFLDFRGKISVSGNAKKRHYTIKKGMFSKSKKNNKFFYIQNQIRTKTGVLGCNYLLCF